MDQNVRSLQRNRSLVYEYNVGNYAPPQKKKKKKKWEWNAMPVNIWCE